VFAKEIKQVCDEENAGESNIKKISLRGSRRRKRIVQWSG